MTYEESVALQNRVANDDVLREMLMFEPEKAAREFGLALSGKDIDGIQLGIQSTETKLASTSYVQDPDKMLMVVFKVAH